LPCGTSGLDFNEEPAQGVIDALSSPERLDDVLLDRLLLKTGEHLSLLAAPALLERGFDADANAYDAVLDTVRRITPCIIVDIPHAWTPWIRQTLLAADEIVVVATPDLPSLRTGRAFFDLLRQNRPNDAPPKLVLNQVGVPKRPEIPVKDFAETLGVQPSVTVPFEPQLFGAAANNAQMLMQAGPKSSVSDAVRQLADILTGRTTQPETQKSVLPFMSLLKARKQA
jgi:pilus assembly protein CpaE